MTLTTFTSDYSTTKQLILWLLSHDKWFMVTPVAELTYEVAVQTDDTSFARSIFISDPTLNAMESSRVQHFLY